MPAAEHSTPTTSAEAHAHPHPLHPPEHGFTTRCGACGISITWYFDDPDADTPYGHWFDPDGRDLCPATDENADDQSHTPATPQQASLRRRFPAPPTNPTDGPVHDWFGLSYSNYLVMHRTLMQSMPTSWQERMVACLEEIHDAFAHLDHPEAFTVQAATEHQVSDLTDAQQKQLGITADWLNGALPPEHLAGDERREWEIKHEDPNGPVYHQDGRELDRQERVLLPAPDPIPHYNRGRTYIEPRRPRI